MAGKKFANSSIHRFTQCVCALSPKVRIHEGERERERERERDSFSGLMGPGGADLRFISPQPDTSRSCETTDTGVVHCVVCPCSTRQLLLVLIINRLRRDSRLSWRCVGALSPRVGFEPATSRSQVRRSTTLPLVHN